jgi:hypothetical protein
MIMPPYTAFTAYTTFTAASTVFAAVIGTRLGSNTMTATDGYGFRTGLGRVYGMVESLDSK